LNFGALSFLLLVGGCMVVCLMWLYACTSVNQCWQSLYLLFFTHAVLSTHVWTHAHHGSTSSRIWACRLPLVALSFMLKCNYEHRAFWVCCKLLWQLHRATHRNKRLMQYMDRCSYTFVYCMLYALYMCTPIRSAQAILLSSELWHCTLVVLHSCILLLCYCCCCCYQYGTTSRPATHHQLVQFSCDHVSFMCAYVQSTILPKQHTLVAKYQGVALCCRNAHTVMRHDSVWLY
jgi:hypothetical protein